MLRRIGDMSVILLSCVFVFFMWRMNARVNALETALVGLPEREPMARAKMGTVSNDGVVIGSTGAPVTVVQFTDYRCPFCARFAKEVMPTIHGAYIATGKVRFVVRDLPLKMHSDAHELALAARCAAALTPRIDEFQDALYAGAGTPADSLIDGAGAAVNIDKTALRSCIDSGDYNREIAKDSAAASALGVGGTPAFLVGISGDSIRGRIITGAKPLAVFTAVIDSVLMSVLEAAKHRSS